MTTHPDQPWLNRGGHVRSALAARLRGALMLLGAILAGAGATRGAEAVGVGRANPDGPDTRWETPAVAAPRVSHHGFASRAAGCRVTYHLYTPAAHDRDPQARFPVVYWLHGTGGGLAGIRPLAARFDAAITAGQLPPCFVVFVHGLPEGMYVNWKDGSVKVEAVLIEDLIPHLDAHHRTVADRSGRIIEGFSMGGYGAARLGLGHPHLFAGVSLLGAGPLQPDFSQAPRAGPRRRDEIFQRVYGGDAAYFLAVSPWMIAARQAGGLGGMTIRQVIGGRDETLENNRVFHERLTALGIAHEWSVMPGVGHDALGLISGLGERFWAFHRAVFSAPAPGRSPGR
jgi:enterochelin esterase-like enzyme